MSNERERVIGIYKITNIINGHAYVGQSEDIYVRWARHVSDSKNPNRHSYYYPLCCAFRKYGEENFDFEILERCTKSELNDREIYWINLHDTCNNGYNQTIGGEHAKTTEKEKIIQVIHDLETTLLPIKTIAENRNVAIGTVSGINNGKIWYDEERRYPIRGHLQKIQAKENAEKNKLTPKKQKIVLEKKKCPICGKIIQNRSTYCLECRKNERSKNIPPKDELLNKIVKYPFVQIGKMYGVSDNAVRKWCKKYNLPFKAKDIEELKRKLK